MLTLTRSVGETIRIGDDIEIHVVEVRGGTVRLGFLRTYARFEDLAEGYDPLEN